MTHQHSQFSIVSFNSSEQASFVSSQYLRDEHSLVDNSILINRLGVAAVELAANLESFLFEVLPTAFDLTCSFNPEDAQRRAFLQERECRNDDTPKIYVSCLSSYNSGRLWGMWVDMSQEIDDVHQDIKDLLALSPVAHLDTCEDWRIDDYECFENVFLSPHESLERVSAIAHAVSEHGQPFTLYLDYSGEEDISAALDKFQERYCGCYESIEDYVYEYYSSTGMLQQIEQAGLNSYYIDFQAIARDWECSGDIIALKESGSTVHVFYNH